jgi:pimeloyl-ACP methyl ester carboxylesterase
MRHEPRRQEALVNTITSADGTRIAFWSSGQGPPLLLVHGATADHTTTWRFVRSSLEQHFTVHAMDRRGRGGSGDAEEYDLRREAEDVAAVVNSIGGPVRVLGHSYGALCAIEAALLSTNVHQLVLYEGVPLRGADAYPAGLLDRFDALLDAGDLDGVLTTMYRDLVGLPPPELELLRSQTDAWAVRLRNAPTLPREARAEQRYRFVSERFQSLYTPTLLLVGGESPEREHDNARAVALALSDARVVVLPGQQHVAMFTAPDLFVNEVLHFFTERETNG